MKRPDRINLKDKKENFLNPDGVPSGFNTHAVTREWLREVREKKFGKDETLLKILIYDEMFSLWWMIDNRNFFHNTSRILRRTENILRFIGKTPIDNMPFDGRDRETLNILYSVAKSKKIKPENIKEYRNSDWVLILRFIAVLIFISVGMLIRKVIFLFNRRKYPGNPDILISSIFLNWKETHNLKSAKKRNDDQLFSYVIDELMSRKKKVFITDYICHMGLGLRICRERFKRYNSPDIYYRPLETYINFSTYLTIVKKSMSLVFLWRRLRRARDFQNIFSYEGVHLWNVFEKEISLLFYQYFPLAIFYIEAMKRLLDKEKPGVLVHAPEAGFYGRAFTAVARSRKVPSVGVCHSIIHSTSPIYTHTPYDFSPDGEFVGTAFCPICDRTAVYSESARGNLLKFGYYPGEKVVVTGSPRYDIFAAPGKYLRREAVFRELDINPEKKIALFIAQPKDNFDRYYQGHHEDVCRAIFKACSDFPGLQLVIKLHHHETEKYYRQYIKKYQPPYKIVITKDTNIFELLYNSEFMMTLNSNAALESIILKRPVVIINFSKSQDIIPYVEKGTAFGVYKEENLAETIEQILNGGIPAEMKQNWEVFVSDYLCRIDGLANSRIARMVLDLLPKQEYAERD